MYIDYYSFLTAGYISIHYFRFEHFLFDHFVGFFKAKFHSSQLQSVFWERHAEYIHHVFQLKK